MEKPEAPLNALFIDNPHAPEVFVSFISGAAFDGPNVRLTFASSRVNHVSAPGPVNNVVNARLVMSIQSVENMVDFLHKFLAASQANNDRPPNMSLN